MMLNNGDENMSERKTSNNNNNNNNERTWWCWDSSVWTPSAGSMMSIREEIIELDISKRQHNEEDAGNEWNGK
jgi:hypothetical protein